MFSVIRSGVAVVVALSLPGCGSGADSSRSAPTSAAAVSRSPIITTLSVTRGSTSGGTSVNITGTELHRGATVTFGTAAVRTAFDPRYPDTAVVETPAHPAGLIDVTLVNIDGQTFRLSRGFEYVPPESFELNGNWGGYTADGTDTFLEFTIRNNVLVTASCRSAESWDVTRTAALSTAVGNGEFSSKPHDAFVLSGRIVSDFQVVGQMGAPCSSGIHPFRAILPDR